MATYLLAIYTYVYSIEAFLSYGLQLKEVRENLVYQIQIMDLILNQVCIGQRLTVFFKLLLSTKFSVCVCVSASQLVKPE